MGTALRNVAVGGLVIVAMIAAVLVGDGATGPDDTERTGVTGAGEGIASLRAFDGCDQLETHVQTILRRSGTDDAGVPVGMTADLRFSRSRGDVAVMDGAAAAESAPRAAAQRSSDDRVSSTNVQELGIDEPDIVKSDGDRLLAVTNDALHIVDLTAGDPRLASSVTLEEGQHQLLLVDGRALVVSQTWHHPVPEPLTEDADAALMPMRIAPPETQLTLFDLTDPGAPREIASATVDGNLVSARETDGTVRLVLRSWPNDIDLRVPTDPVATDAAERHNRAAIRSIDARQVLPRLTVRDERGRTLRDGSAVDCTAVSRPASPSGVGTTTVLTLRPDDGDLVPEDSTSVLADSEVVYASADRLYVATSRWVVPEADGADVAAPWMTGDVMTELHAFDTTVPAATRHVASGSVRGRLLNQWSLSERDGVLRVAVTREGPVGAAPEPSAEGPRSDSAIVTMTERAGALVQLGEVGGLGPGERIFAVRYFDELATVVTFRQIDPLYTVDLSDPGDPRVLGELKIPGFSNYLHPVADGWLVGIGQDADEEGRQLGVQVSLFDIRDLSAPDRAANLVLGQGHTEIQHDHHAFLWWPDRRLAVIPLELWQEAPGDGEPADRRGAPWTGAVLVRVDTETGSLQELTRISHPPEDQHGAGIRRTLVADGNLLTVSHVGVKINDLETLDERAWIAF